MFTIEYLVIIEKLSSPALFALCDSISAFNKFLQNEQSILIERSSETICLANDNPLSYKVDTGEVQDKQQRFFRVQISTENVDRIPSLVSLSRSLKRIVINGGGQIETLWDDVSLYYSHQAYPLIHRIENLMRKLIAFFMLTIVGREWVDTASPEAIRKQIDSKQKQYIDALFQVDFIQLADLLFKPYTTKDIQDLYNLVDEQEDLSELTSDYILEFKARSNWDRYLSDFVDCEAAYLSKRWSQLYKLRCDVAHNKLFGEANYQDVVRLVQEIEPFLLKALEAANRVEVSDEDKEQIAESVAGSISALYGAFIETWKLLESRLMDLASQSEDETSSVNQALKKLTNEMLIDEDNAKQIYELSRLRNSIVHDAAVDLNESQISQGIESLKTILENLPIIDSPVSFHADCIKRLESYLETKLKKKSRTTYFSENEDLTLTCAVSKLHDRKPRPYYWFGFHQRQLDFLKNSQSAYAAFGCGSAEKIILFSLKELIEYLQNCNTTETPRFYWHIQIHSKNDKLYLHQKSGNHSDVSKHLL